MLEQWNNRKKSFCGSAFGGGASPNSRVNLTALSSFRSWPAGRRGSSDSHQLYGAQLSCPLNRFGVIVWAASCAQTVSQSPDAMILYRPTGLAELRLVAEAGWTAWPPRLPDQPSFYPVLSLEYARQIARDWNSKDSSSGYIGFVTKFELDNAFAAKYSVQLAGGHSHEELWVPADELLEFNHQIVGKIEVIESHPGPNFQGNVDPATHLPNDLETCA